MTHTYIHTYTRAHMHTHTRMHTHTYMHTYIHACIHTYVRTYMHTYIHTHTHTHTHTYQPLLASKLVQHTRTHRLQEKHQLLSLRHLPLLLIPLPRTTHSILRIPTTPLPLLSLFHPPEACSTPIPLSPLSPISPPPTPPRSHPSQGDKTSSGSSDNSRGGIMNGRQEHLNHRQPGGLG